MVKAALYNWDMAPEWATHAVSDNYGQGIWCSGYPAHTLKQMGEPGYREEKFPEAIFTAAWYAKFGNRGRMILDWDASIEARPRTHIRPAAFKSW